MGKSRLAQYYRERDRRGELRRAERASIIKARAQDEAKTRADFSAMARKLFDLRRAQAEASPKRSRRRTPWKPTLDPKARTRIVAALIQGIDPATIARDQKVCRRIVLAVAAEERGRL